MLIVKKSDPQNTLVIKQYTQLRNIYIIQSFVDNLTYLGSNILLIILYFNIMITQKNISLDSSLIYNVMYNKIFLYLLPLIRLTQDHIEISLMLCSIICIAILILKLILLHIESKLYLYEEKNLFSMIQNLIIQANRSHEKFAELYLFLRQNLYFYIKSHFLIHYLIGLGISAIIFTCIIIGFQPINEIYFINLLPIPLYAYIIFSIFLKYYKSKQSLLKHIKKSILIDPNIKNTSIEIPKVIIPFFNGIMLYVLFYTSNIDRVWSFTFLLLVLCNTYILKEQAESMQKYALYKTYYHIILSKIKRRPILYGDHAIEMKNFTLKSHIASNYYFKVFDKINFVVDNNDKIVIYSEDAIGKSSLAQNIANFNRQNNIFYSSQPVYYDYDFNMYFDIDDSNNIFTSISISQYHETSKNIISIALKNSANIIVLDNNLIDILTKEDLEILIKYIHSLNKTVILFSKRPIQGLQNYKLERSSIQKSQ